MFALLGKQTDPSDFREVLDCIALSFVQILHSESGNDLLLREADGREWRLSQPDMSCLGLLHGAGDAAAAAEVRRWWSERSGTALQVCDLSSAHSAIARRTAAAEWLCGRLVAVLAMLGQQNKELLNHNRQLRRSYGALQTAFSRVEHFVVSNQLHTPVLQYESARIVSFWKPETRGQKLTQVLPVMSSRLSYLELNFRRSVMPGAGELRIALRLEPSGTTLNEWAVPFGELVTGWNSFCPNTVVDEPNEVLLECTWSDVQGAPSVGLAAPHWETPYSIDAGTGPAAAGDEPAYSLGMRIWSGLAGVRAPRLSNAPAQKGGGNPRVLDLPVDELSGARQYKFSETVEHDYRSVSFLQESSRLLVHPHGGVATIAVLPSPVPEGILTVSGDARTNHPDGPDIEYALAVLEPDVAPESVFAANDGKEPFAGFSGWHRVKRGEAQRIATILDRPTGPGLQLYVATRVPAGSNESFAWGTWGGLEFSETAPPRRPIGPSASPHAASGLKSSAPATPARAAATSGEKALRRRILAQRQQRSGGKVAAVKESEVDLHETRASPGLQQPAPVSSG